MTAPADRASQDGQAIDPIVRPDRTTAIVVVNYGSSALLAQNLPGSAHDGHLVVVVDSWSSSGEREKVLRLAAEHGWLVETPIFNTGFGTGSNLGAARALREGATSLFFLNPDARIDPTGLARLIDQVETDRSLLLAPRILNVDGSPWMSGTMDLRMADGTVGSSRRRQPRTEVMEWVSGAAMALSAELWTRTGGFDDDYFLYWEDIDLCRRVHGAGGTIRVDQSVTAIHDEGATHTAGGSRAKSEIYYFYNIRNRALYATKWLAAFDRRRWAWQTPRTALDTLLKGGRRQFLQSVQPWRAYVRGVLTAYRVPPSGKPMDGTEVQPDSGAVVRVLESFAEPTRSTNPYITQLRDALVQTPGVSVECWSWRTALIGRYDVFHTHWTEALIERRSPASTAVRRLLFAAFVLRLWVTRAPVVRTVHNLGLPTGLSRSELFLLNRIDALTTVQIVLNRFTPVPDDGGSVLIEHGHYRDWFTAYPEPGAVRGRLTFIGKVRRYKNVEGLVRAFSSLPADGDPYSLHVAGKPSTAELADALVQLAGVDHRVKLSLGFVEDVDLVREVGESELVVLPYHEMHNSGSVLAALSLDRPVLVPDNEFNRALAGEVGDGWVIGFSGELSADSINRALDDTRRSTRGDRPDLSAREWSDAGLRHRNAYRLALSTVRDRRSVSR